MGRESVYNPIFTEEKYRKVCQENRDLLDEFLDYLISIDRAEKTIINYRSDIRIFFIWNEEYNKNIPFFKFTKRHMIRYQNYMLNVMSVKSQRVRRLRSALSSMSNFIENILDEDYPDFRNIINKIEAPSITPAREKSVFQKEEIEELLEYLVEKEKYQHACALALALYSGSRKSELLRFKTNYFDEKNLIFGSLYKTPEKIKTKGRGTQGKLIFKYTLKNNFKKYFDIWNNNRKDLNIEHDNLLVSKKGESYEVMNIASLDYMCSEFTGFLGKPFYWHSMRHLYTTMLSENKIPDNVIKEICGWASVDLVATYTDTEVESTLGDYFNEEGIIKQESKTLEDM